MAKFQYTVLSFHEGSNTRTFGSFTSTRKDAEAKLPALKEKYPDTRFEVASVRVN